jgi:uncharacterized membrane protein YfcA
MAPGIITLCIAAFVAGFIDAIVGGGGLIQTPAVLITLPDQPVATLLGTTKIPSFTGTSIAALQYSRIVQLQWKLLAFMCTIALLAAYGGSRTVAVVSNAFMKPIILVILIVVAIYTYSKKNFGIAVAKNHSAKKEWLLGGLFASAIGFYDGFIGPGAGSFLVLFFISIIGFDFLRASAHAKFVNLATNIGSIIYFSGSGHILYQYALPMAVFNFCGSVLGARLAIVKGNRFIRSFFLLIVAGTIIRFAYDIFFRH